jgi:hypothetical protein
MMRELYSLPRNNASVTFRVAPWDFMPREPIPDGIKGEANKNARTAWACKPSTEHCFYSGFEGLNPGLRIGKDNPVVKMHALIADYDRVDTPLEDAKESITSFKKLPFMPNYICSTLSGGVRAVWVMEEPLNLNTEMAKKYLRFLKKTFHLNKLVAGLDDKACVSPSVYYEAGQDWQQLSSSPIPTLQNFTWMQSCLAKEHLATEIEESVPMDRVLTELRARYPDVAFPDNFDVGVRMHRFWDEGANNESAAYVMEGGIYCHTGEEGFKPWGNSDLLGPDFMREFEVQKTGVIIDEFWYDGSNYISRNPRTDGWLIESEKNTILNIAARYGLLKCPSKKGELSPIERLLFEVQMTQRVKAYAKFIHLPEGLLEFQGDQYINISQVKAMSPSGMEGEWGEHFPFLAKFIDGLMVDDTQKLILLAWWKRFYKGALKQRPNRGQIMIIAGPPACGKTLLNTKMLAPSVGGGIDAADYYINGADFSGSFYDYPLHMVDDGEPGRRHDAQKRMAGRYKKTAASDSLSVNQKFEKIKQIQWLGRVCTTMNSDPESMKQMPELQHTLEDKVIILRANEPNGLLEQTKQINKVVDEERCSGSLTGIPLKKWLAEHATV